MAFGGRINRSGVHTHRASHFRTLGVATAVPPTVNVESGRYGSYSLFAAFLVILSYGRSQVEAHRLSVVLFAGTKRLLEGPLRSVHILTRSNRLNRAYDRVFAAHLGGQRLHVAQFEVEVRIVLVEFLPRQDAVTFEIESILHVVTRDVDFIGRDDSITVGRVVLDEFFGRCFYQIENHVFHILLEFNVALFDDAADFFNLIFGITVNTVDGIQRATAEQECVSCRIVLLESHFRAFVSRTPIIEDAVAAVVVQVDLLVARRRADEAVTVAHAGQREARLGAGGRHEGRAKAVMVQHHARVGLVEEAVCAIAVVADAPEGVVVDDGARVEDEQLRRAVVSVPLVLRQSAGQHLVVAEAEDVPRGIFGHRAVGGHVGRLERHVHVVEEGEVVAVDDVVARHNERQFAIGIVIARQVGLLGVERIERTQVGSRDR